MKVAVEKSVHVFGPVGLGGSMLEVYTSHIEEAVAERTENGWKATATTTATVGMGVYELVIWWAKEEA